MARYISRKKEEVFAQIKRTISGRMLRLLDDNYNHSPRIIRIEIACPRLDSLGWLSWQSADSRFYWLDRDGELEVSGIGIADSFKSSGRVDYTKLFFAMRKRLSINDKRMRYYGGIGFLNEEPSKEWGVFGSSYFMMPEFEIFRTGKETFFAFNIREDRVNKLNIKKAICRLNKLRFSGESPENASLMLSYLRHYPNRARWEDIFKSDIPASADMLFEKIVLARRTIINFKDKVDSLALFSKLKHESKGCFCYYFQPSEDMAFLGATPERLFRRQGSHVESEAIAGTRARGKSKKDDRFYQDDLFSSTKEALEHQYVVNQIKSALAKFSSTLEFDQTPSILKLNTAMHLLTRFKGKLKNGASDAQLLSALHPTPAVAGHPLGKALAAIAKIEQFSRGWYSGPIGFIGHDEVNLAVALRCALVYGKKINLFAGAGIVCGSTAEGEWQEIENKSSAYMNILNHSCSN